MLLYFSLTLLIWLLVFGPSPRAVPKGSALNFGLDVAEMRHAAQNDVRAAWLQRDAVARERVPTFANVVAAMARTRQDIDAKLYILPFLSSVVVQPKQSNSSVAVDMEIRDASTNATQHLNDYTAECSERGDIYRAVRAVFDNADEMAKLDHEDRRLVEKMELEYRHLGALLPPEKCQTLAGIKRRLSMLESDFERCMREQDAKMLFTRDELEGLPEDYFDGRTVEAADGVTKYVVTSKYPDYRPLLAYAKRERTRRAMLVAAETRCPDNILRLQEMVQLRHESAQLLGYSSYSEYAMSSFMARSPRIAMAMEEELRVRLAAPAARELAELGALKKADVELAGDEYEGFFNWDTAYYARIAKESKYSIQEDEVRQYFALGTTLRGILDIIQQILGVRITQVANPSVWHPDVAMYEVWEAAESVFVGHLYLDLHPRQGKYSQAAMFQLRSGFTRSDGTREYPAAAIVANFPRATSAAPALLTHDNVVTLMHELGHAFHNLCAHTKWGYFHGTKVEGDFIETPSQMLENWGWDPASLRKFAVHYKTGEPIPDDLVAKLVAAKNQGAGLDNLYQVFLGLFDLAIHSSTNGNVDVLQMFNDMRSEISMIGNGNAVTHKVTTFGHLAGGFASLVYSYMWSHVFSADMYATRFQKEGLDNATTGMDYRTETLRPGGSRDAMESMVRFLGRKPNNNAFLESIGLQDD
ncbi:metalloendopeptidase [Coemansia spiralis]|nr:metalloendopeptidase [Coemansia spiralis]